MLSTLLCHHKISKEIKLKYLAWNDWGSFNFFSLILRIFFFNGPGFSPVFDFKIWSFQ